MLFFSNVASKSSPCCSEQPYISYTLRRVQYLSPAIGRALGRRESDPLFYPDARKSTQLISANGRAHPKLRAAAKQRRPSLRLV